MHLTDKQSAMVLNKETKRYASSSNRRLNDIFRFPVSDVLTNVKQLLEKPARTGDGFWVCSVAIASAGKTFNVRLPSFDRFAGKASLRVGRLDE